VHVSTKFDVTMLTVPCITAMTKRGEQAFDDHVARIQRCCGLTRLLLRGDDDALALRPSLPQLPCCERPALAFEQHVERIQGGRQEQPDKLAVTEAQAPEPEAVRSSEQKAAARMVRRHSMARTRRFDDRFGKKLRLAMLAKPRVCALRSRGQAAFEKHCARVRRQ
jgi:hypothetical protein